MCEICNVVSPSHGCVGGKRTRCKGCATDSMIDLKSIGRKLVLGCGILRKI